ncbi:MAG: outer membrane beta-barrel protein [Parafilimonas sp.]
MKRLFLSMAILLLSYSAFSQEDTAANNKSDTMHVGNFIIIKKNKSGDSNDSSKDRHYTIDVNIGHHNHNNEDSDEDNANNNETVHVHHRNISTNYFIFDLGFANWRDNTDYESDKAQAFLLAVPGAQPFTKDDLKLSTGKSSNVNLWLFMQKLNVSKHVLNLKYGLGLEMYNYRYKTNLSYHDNRAYIFRDTINFSKNKLYVSYVSVPFMINLNATPEKKQGFSISAGFSAGYRIGSHTKQISDERGKDKTHGDFNLNPWRFAYVAEVGLGPVRLYGSYSINQFYQTAVKQYPYTVGLRFSNW